MEDMEMTIDFATIMEADEMEERELILAEERAAESLTEKANYLEAIDFENEFEELVERARLTADQNPLSETAYYIQEELAEAIATY